MLRSRRHSRLSVYLQEVEFARLRPSIVVTQVGPTDATAPEHPVGAQGDVERALISFGWDRSGCQVIGSACCIFCGVVIKTATRNDLADAQRAIPHHRDGELAPGNKALDHDLAAEAPTCNFLAPRIVVDPYDANPDAGTLIGRFDDERRRHRIAQGEFARASNYAFDDRQAGTFKDRLRGRLVHG